MNTRFRKYILTASMAVMSLCVSNIHAQSVSYRGGSHEIVSLMPDKNTGLDYLFVAYSTSQTELVYTSTSGASDVKWYRFSNLGGGYAEEIQGVSRNGNKWTLSSPQGDLGYMIEEPGKRTSLWICEYSKHPLNITGIDASPVQDCDRTHVVLTGTGDALTYYTVNGQRRVIDQQIEIRYNTLQWSEDSKQWLQVSETHNVNSFTHEVYLAPPAYCNTTFEVSADRFLRQWGMEQRAVSATFHANAVDQRTEAVQQDNGSDDEDYKSNVIKGEESALGGSAPAVITFYGYPTDAVRHSEWQISTDSEFETIDQRFVQQDLEYTFLQEGVQYVRYIASNDDGSCESVSDTYTVSIGASEIKCPNAFSPGASEGVNDEWKVSYRSITQFECWIFDRWGQEMCHFSDPSQGWDGRYRGKLVKPGAYYYVIQATGADGKKYKLSGDINILNFKTVTKPSTDQGEE